MTESPATPPQEQAERATLSRDLADFLIEFSIALNKHAMYPSGHPSLQPAADRVIFRIEPLLANRGSLSLGVARDQLVIEGVATDPKNPVLADLAARLHRHHLGALAFRRGVETEELREVLRLLATDADRTGAALGMGPPEQLTAWPHLQMFPLHYDRLDLIEEERPEGEESDEARTRAAQLWVGLARAALAAVALDESDESLDSDPDSVAKAIVEHERTAAYDQVIVGYMLQIAEELRSAKGREAVELKKRMQKLVKGLDSGTLESLVDMGGDRPQRRQFMLNASEGMAADAMIDLLTAAANTEQKQMSHSLLRMFQKLAQHAESGRGKRKLEAESTLRDQMAAMIQGWSLSDPNPDGYAEALQRMTSAESVYAVSPEQRYRPEAERVFKMAVETDAMGEQVKRAVDELTEQGKLKWVLDTLHAEGAPQVTDGVWQHAATAENVGRVATTEPIDEELLDLMLPKVGLSAAEPMLDALAQVDSGHDRQLLINRIVRLGSEVGPLAMERIEDSRPHVVRNMLTIIGHLPEAPAGFNPADYMRNADSLVRSEAIRLVLHDPAGRERAICVALADPDERIVRMGLAGAQEACPDSAVSLVTSRATEAKDTGLRATAVRVLGSTRHPLALRTLLTLAEPRRKFLFWSKLPPKTPEYLAALTALVRHAAAPSAQRALAAALKSRDLEIVRAAADTATETPATEPPATETPVSGTSEEVQ